jgi:hypothetical protein
MPTTTKAKQLLESTGFETWGSSDKEIGQIIDAMEKIVAIYESERKKYDSFIKEWFVDEIEVSED